MNTENGSKTLHVAYLEKFIPPFISFIRNEFKGGNQEFYTYGNIESYPYEIKNDTHHATRKINKFFTFFSRYIPLLIKMYQADKIMLHGLFDIFLVLLLFLNPSLLKKCHWFIWGGDLYCCKDSEPGKFKTIKEFFRKRVIKNIGYLVTYLPGDVDLAREWYGAKGQYIECIMYPSNTCNNSHVKVASAIKDENRGVVIQVGNSADPRNNHVILLDELRNFKDRIIKIYLPLSYGDKNYAKNVIRYGSEIYGEKFVGLEDFLPLDKYIEILSVMDIAVFGHERQQAMGNTISLLSLGKTVYIKSGTSQWNLFKRLGIKVLDISKFNCEVLSKRQIEENMVKTNSYFSRVMLKKQLAKFL